MLGRSSATYSEGLYEKRDEEKEKRNKIICVLATLLALVGTILTVVLLIHAEDDDNNNNGGHGGIVDPASQVVDWPNSTATLVESVPFVDFNLSKVPGVGTTFQAHLDLINNATSTIDISVMYWNLIASNSSNGDFTEAQFEAFGSEEGAQIFEAMNRACQDRNVAFRFVQDNSSSFGAPVQLMGLKGACPDLVSIHYWNASHFYKGGVMHMKLWIVDDLHVYIGSANMDWLSYTQVKEMGIVIRNDPQVAADVRSYFETWRRWAEPLNTFTGPSGEAVTSPLDMQMAYFSPRFRMNLVAPCFSFHNNECENPFVGVPKYTPFIPTLDTPLNITLNNESASYFVTGAPQEANFVYEEESGAFSFRTFDEEGIVQTILNADEYVYLSVMDFQPSSAFDEGHGDQPVFWDVFFQALLRVATSKKVQVRVLTSYWAHTSERQVPYLRLNPFFCPSCSDSSNLFFSLQKQTEAFLRSSIHARSSTTHSNAKVTSS